MRNGGGGVILSRMKRRGTQQPYAGRRLWALALLVLALISALALAGKGGASTAYDSEELRFLELINEYRAQNGLRPVILSDTLTVAAERHSRDMAEYGFFAHNTVGSSYYPADSQPWDRMEAEGYRYNTAKGENLAVGYETAEEAMGAWKRSASHNAAMLDGNYRVMGVARINSPGSVHGWYWTTDFGGYVDPSAHASGGGPSTENPAPTTAKEPKESGGSRMDRPGDTVALENGGMREAGAWAERARDGADLVVDDRARLGAYHDGRDDLSQRVRVGGDARLVYDVQIRSGSSDRGDEMVVRLKNRRGERVALLKRYTGRDAAGWRHERLDLSRFAGREVYLSFHVRTDAGRLTTFYLDGVSLKEQGSRAKR